MAEFDVGIAFQLLTDTVDKGNKTLDKMARPVQPIRKNIGVANQPSAAATQTLVIPARPAAGRMWFVHRVVVLGTDGHTSVAGAVADIYTGPAGNITADPTSQIYSGLTLPTIIVEGRHHNPVMYGEQVYALLYGLPAQQVVQFAVGIDEYPAEAMLAMGAG